MSIIGTGQNFRFSVITPTKFEQTGRVNNLYATINDFKHQSYRNLEHIIIYDGYWPKSYKKLSKLIFVHQTKDETPSWKGSGARNFAIDNFINGDYVIFADDDDRFHSDYLMTFIRGGINGKNIGILQMRNIDQVIPTIEDMKEFPKRRTFGSPCLAIPSWIFTDYNIRWKTDEPAGDYHLMNDIMNNINPEIIFIPKVMVSIRGGDNPEF